MIPRLTVLGVLVWWAAVGTALGGAASVEHMARVSSARAFASHVVIPQARAFAITEPHVGVRLTEVRAQVSIVEQVATTTMEISLYNPTSRNQESELLVPVPEGAAVRSFTFEGAASEPTAELLPRAEARRIYDSIVAKSRDPALLEFAGYNLIRSSVFPVEPNKAQKVRLTYERILAAEAGRVEYVLPRSESLEYTVPWHINVQIKSKASVSTVYSPSHRLEVKRQDPHTVLARTLDEAALEPGAFRLTYLPEHNGVSASLMAYPDPKVGGGYFLLLAGLPARPEPEPGSKPLPREVTLVLDRSGSMNGEKIQQVRDAAIQIVEGLEPGEAFNILPYNEAVDAFAEAPVAKSKETVQAARKYIEGIQARGGTNIHDALLEALRQKPTPGALPLVLFLTDGLPTVGNTSEVAIRELAVKANPHQRRIFTFGVGVDVNAPLLDKIADLTRATATYVLPKEDVEAKVGQVFRRLEGPVLAFPELAALTADGRAAPGRVRDLLPARLPDLFDGDQLILLGQYIGEDQLHFNLSGNYMGKKRAFRFSFPLEKATTRNAYVPRLWASRKIGVLVDAIRQLGADNPNQQAANAAAQDPRARELIDEIVRLSQEFGILTEYTAFLARDGTNFANFGENFERANRRFGFRAQGQRAGGTAVSQGDNIKFNTGQDVLNYRNDLVLFNNGRLNGVQFSNVQQVNDKAFFNNSGRWVEGRVASSPQAANPARVVEFGSDEFTKLLERLTSEDRQGSIALRGDIVLEVDKEVILVRNPLHATDVAAAEENNDAGAQGRRSETPDARSLMEAEK